ncbi:YjaG family protein [Gallaecimonas sp. GXIMD4217]|uniref:YjaG family protein n=1 Tax=Gallaecimonas sp. GXIMD4217 TaxID=3131927 RepID=UPI00311B3C25
MEKAIHALSHRGQRAFAAALAARMLPNFQLFAEVVELDNAAQLKASLDTAWEKLLDPKARIGFEKQLEKVAELEPDPAAYDMYGVYPALNAVLAVQAVLSGMMDKDENPALDVSRLSRGTVQDYLNALAGAELADEALDEEPLWQAERDFQETLLALLEGEPGKEEVRQARQLGRNEDISNIGISLS